MNRSLCPGRIVSGSSIRAWAFSAVTSAVREHSPTTARILSRHDDPLSAAAWEGLGTLTDIVLELYQEIVPATVSGRSHEAM